MIRVPLHPPLSNIKFRCSVHNKQDSSNVKIFAIRFSVKSWLSASRLYFLLCLLSPDLCFARSQTWPNSMQHFCPYSFGHGHTNICDILFNMDHIYIIFMHLWLCSCSVCRRTLCHFLDWIFLIWNGDIRDNGVLQSTLGAGAAAGRMQA